MIVAPYLEDRDAASVLALAKRCNDGQAFVWEEDWTDERLLDYWRPAKDPRDQSPGATGNYTGVLYFVPKVQLTSDPVLVNPELQASFAGVYVFHRNHPGRGSHIANASYMAKSSRRHTFAHGEGGDPDATFGGNGLGVLLSNLSLAHARREGFRGMQFNIVVATNQNAVKAWTDAGFEKIGRLPKVYRRSVKASAVDSANEAEDFVDAWVFFKEL